jgi:ATP-dependent protease HslVU (ClpYQ) peptidase subunit
MTLIVVVPTVGGLIVAADSRVTLGAVACDNAFKVTEVQGA